jgi:hypothetical protein
MSAITETHARKILELLSHGLVSGLGEPVPGKMCIEAVVNHALGRPHGDDPGCVAEPLRRLKIRLNDSSWSSNAARAKGLTRLGLAQLGSKGVLDTREFKTRVNTLRIQMLVPIRFRIAAKKQKNAEHRGLLDAAALMLEQSPTRENCIKARDTACKVRDAAADAYADAAAAAAAAADAAYAAAYADAAAAAAAYAYADAAAYADADADAAARDKVLGDFAEAVVQILIDMKAPGCQWLYLTEPLP